MSARICALSAVAVAIALIGVAGERAPNNNTVKKLTKAVTADGVLAHLEAFQGIADEFGNRAAGQPGYEASVDYVVEQLEGAGYTPEVQAFDFEYFDENNVLRRNSPAPTTFVDESDFLRNNFDTGFAGGHRDRHAGPGRPGHQPEPAGELQHERLRGGRLRRVPGRRHRAGPARHVRLRRQGAQRAGRRRGGRRGDERGPARPDGLST